MTRSQHQSSSHAPNLDCVGQPIIIDPNLRAKEVARVDSKIIGYRSNVGIAMWARWMTNETEEDLKHKAFRNRFLHKIGKFTLALKKRSTDPDLSAKARKNAARKLRAAEAIGFDSTDLIEIAKALAMPISATAKRRLE